MSNNKIIIYPDRCLRQKAKAIDVITDEHLQILANMQDIMQEASGIGLAAPQIDISLRLVVIYIPESEDSLEYNYSMINPEVTSFGEEIVISSEGCLSLPGLSVDLPRSEEIDISYTDIDNNQQTLTSVSGLLSRCLQHEIDHLDGKLIVDYLSPLQRTRTVAAWKRSLKRNDI